MAVDTDALFKQMARKRVNIFFAIFLLIAMAAAVADEVSTSLLFATDEIMFVVIALMGIIYLVAMSQKKSLKDLRIQNNMLFLLFLIALIIQLVWMPIEFGTSDFGDDVPMLIFFVLAVLNRFL